MWTICNSSTAATPTEKSQLKTTEHPPGADDVSKGIDSIDLSYAGLEDSLDPLLLYPHLVLKKKHGGFAEQQSHGSKNEAFKIKKNHRSIDKICGVSSDHRRPWRTGLGAGYSKGGRLPACLLQGLSSSFLAAH